MIKNHHEFILHATEVVKGCAVYDVHVRSAGGIMLKSLHIVLFAFGTRNWHSLCAER